MGVVIILAPALMSLIRIPCAQHIAASLHAKRYYRDIVYNNTSGLWACCAEPFKTPDCENPRPETFQATPLDQLKVISVRSATTTLPSTTSSPKTSAATTVGAGNITEQFPSTSRPTDTSDPTLGSDAKVGIVVGAVITGVLTSAGIIFLIRRSKRRKRIALGGLDQAADQPADVFTGGKPELDSSVRAELDVTAPAELDARSIRVQPD
ncbi:hypothetical protein MMC07_001925 [Pseudocyphellaria aurata]|nr:hypothetical protein [Pseudocyphellaria aurata]